MPYTFSRPRLRWSLAALAFSCLGTLSPLWAKQVLPKAGGERQINVQTFGDQTSPAIAADAQGNYAIAWLGPDEIFRPHLFVRLFEAGGAPRCGEILVDEEAANFEEPKRPRVAMSADGHFVVLWSASHAWARLYDAQGRALGTRIRTDDVPLFSGTAADLAMRPEGSFVVTWLGVATSSGVYARSFDAGGHPLEAGRRLDANPPASQQAEPRALFLASGDSLILWVRQQSPAFLQHDSQLVAVRRSIPNGPWSAEIELLGLRGASIPSTVPVAHPEGGFSVVWALASDFIPPAYPTARLIASRFNADGDAATEPRLLPFSAYFEGAPAAASDAHGNTLVIAAYNYDLKPEGRLFDRDWNQIGAEVQVVTFEGDSQVEPAATAAGEGFVAAWTSGTYPPIFFPPVYGQDGNGFGIFAQRFAPPLCAPGSKVLCLGADGRFELSVDWKTLAGTEGSGRAHPLTSDTGAFWFFDPDNLELLTKVLDGLEVNGHFWVFSGGISDVDYTLEVLDSLTGERRNYHNTQGQLISRADTEAFTGYAGIPLCVVGAGQSAEIESGSRDSVASTAPLTPVPSCPPGNPESLCFQIDSTFQLGVDFIDPRSGLHGRGQAVPLTGNSGAFSFFDASNLELIVKVLDGRAVNGKFWFFFGGLSDVDYTITVRNLATQEVRTYTNSRGQLQSRADTQAFGF